VYLTSSLDLLLSLSRRLLVFSEHICGHLFGVRTCMLNML
jgi:hypothetical protein